MLNETPPEPPATLEFPVDWEDPSDAERPWRFERWHSPRPITPLAFDFAQHIYIGFSRGWHATGAPFRTDMRRINCYGYMGLRLATPDDPVSSPADRQPERMQNHARWLSTWLPEVQGYLSAWQAFHGRTTHSDEELLSHLRASFEWVERSWEIHGRLSFGVGTLLELMRRALNWDDAETHLLLAGVENLSLESDNALRALAQSVGDNPAATEAIHREPAIEVLHALAAAGAGEVLERFSRFLDRFGRKSDNFAELSLPSWREDPTPLVAVIRAYLTHPAHDHGAVRERVIADSEAAEIRARSLLRGKPADVLREFEQELVFCRDSVALNEDHNYWIDQQTMYCARMDMLAAGRILASNQIIDDANDVFLLTIPEVMNALEGERTRMAEAVSDRRDEMEHWAQIEPPSELGAPAPAVIAEAINPLFGEVNAIGTDTLIEGMAASKGVVTARARIINSIAEADLLRPGEVLVVETTSPPWTPLFGIAGAIVTDGGGPLSHAAVVAREYAIPAVVGTVSGTRRIRSGQLVKVDGGAGTIELLES